MILENLLNGERGRILFECVSGSRAYGTHSANSDTDIRGVFAQSMEEFVSLEVPTALIADDRHNTVYYSLRRTIELLTDANPNILELLYMPEDCVQICTPEFECLIAQRQIFLTKQCADTHIGYAFSQIKKAKGQNKWINQPQPEAIPKREDFCHIIFSQPLSSNPLSSQPARPVALAKSGVSLAHCHAARVEHSGNLYRLYDYGVSAKGVFRGDALAMESIPAEDELSHFVGLLLFNEPAWHQAKQDHENYWTWRRERNEDRWRQQESGALDFDAKNLMHTVRLLLSGKSILTKGMPLVRVTGNDLELLLQIRNGKMTYEEIIQIANALKQECALLRDSADLPDRTDRQKSTQLLREITHAWSMRR